MLKTQIFEKSSFPENKCICPIFSQIFECDTPQETIYKSQKDFLTSNLRVIRVFLSNWEVAENTNFLKKGSFPENKCICPIFSQIVECDKPQETIYKSKKDILTSSLQVKRVVLGPERLLKTQNLEKKCSFPVNKCICPLFSQIVECDKPQQTIYKSRKVILTITVVVIR